MQKIRLISVLLLVLSLASCQFFQQFPSKVTSIAKHKQAKRKSKSYNSSYKIKKGDTLYSIAWQYGLNVRDLARINHIKSPYIIYPGKTIRLSSSKRSKKKQKLTVKVSSLYKNKFGNKSSTKAKLVSKPNSSSKPKYKPKYAPNANATAKNSSRKLPYCKWAWPAKGKKIKGFLPGKTNANGIDISNQEGTRIVAAAAGRVVYSGSALRGYGNLIIIKHENNFLSAYAHNRKNMVKEGDTVAIGQQIGEMGCTGTDRSMLHFEVRYQGKPIDPEKVLPR